MPVVLLAGCAWVSYACRLRGGSYACDVCRRLRLVMLLDVALGLLMPLMLLAGCAWASYACDVIHRLRLGLLFACDVSRRLRPGFLCP